MSVRALALIASLAAAVGGCSNEDRDPDPNADLPQACRGHCISPEPVTTSGDCCDSVTCWWDDETDAWVVTFCDPAPPDGGLDARPDARTDARTDARPDAMPDAAPDAPFIPDAQMTM